MLSDFQRNLTECILYTVATFTHYYEAIETILKIASPYSLKLSSSKLGTE